MNKADELRKEFEKEKNLKEPDKFDGFYQVKNQHGYIEFLIDYRRYIMDYSEWLESKITELENENKELKNAIDTKWKDNAKYLLNEYRKIDKLNSIREKVEGFRSQFPMMNGLNKWIIDWLESLLNIIKE